MSETFKKAMQRKLVPGMPIIVDSETAKKQ
jgi:hypothetical protein